MTSVTLWQRIESRLDSSLNDWRNRVDGLDQVAAVKARTDGRAWSDEETFRGLLLAVLSSNTDWSKIDEIRAEIAELFSGFDLKSYSELTASEIGTRFLPWFLERRAGSQALRSGLVNLIDTARLLAEHSRVHGTAESYFTALVEHLDGDPKQAALRLGSRGDEYKLPAFGVALAAEVLKNLGFDVAKPDRHVRRAVVSFGLVPFRKWPNRSGRSAPSVSSVTSHLAVMEAVQGVAATAGIPVVMADNAIWLLCAKSGLYLTNPELAELVREHENPAERAEAVGALIRSWADMQDDGEQRETINHLVEGMNQERLSVRKLFPEEFKSRSW